jgi:hypothetical protein
VVRAEQEEVAARQIASASMPAPATARVVDAFLARRTRALTPVQHRLVQ